MSDSNSEEVTCPACGICFSFPKKVADLWRDSHKQFYCPNGHGMSWTGETSQQKELKSLRNEVKELRAKVDAYQVNEEVYLKQIKDLTNELEIWKPTSK